MDRPIDNKMFDDFCAEYLALEDAKNNLSERQKTAKEKLISMCDGKDRHQSDNNDLTIKRVEAWTWNQTMLEAMKAAIPQISATFTIDKKVYAALPKELQSRLSPALTTKLGRSTIIITTRTSGDS